MAGTDSHRSSSEISPDESASQITPVDGSEGESVTDSPTEEEAIDDLEENELDGDEVEEDELEEEIEEDPMEEDLEEDEVSPEDKVAEYLARQAELALRKEAIAEVKAKGDWHPDEVFLFERLSMRSFEEIFPATWKMEFPTLSGELFTTVPKNTFVNFNCASSALGEFEQVYNS
jgi:hypothetical protein